MVLGLVFLFLKNLFAKKNKCLQVIDNMNSQFDIPDMLSYNLDKYIVIIIYISLLLVTTTKF